MTIRSRVLSASLLVALVSSGPAARAADEAARAQELRAEGNRLMDERRYDEAIKRFEEARQLTPNEPALFYNLARAHDFRGDAVRAVENMEHFLASAPAELKARIPRLDGLVEGMRARVTRVQILCSAPAVPRTADAIARALILVDNQIVATGCATHDIRLPAGRAAFRAEADGYMGQTVDVRLEGGKGARVVLELAPRDTSGLLRLKSEPEHVTVRLEGRELGQTPLEVLLAAGPHRLELSQPGYEPLTLPVVISPNASREARVQLDKTPSIVTRWWFWTAVGALAVAGAGVTIALTTERDPDRGSIAPGLTRLP